VLAEILQGEVVSFGIEVAVTQGKVVVVTVSMLLISMISDFALFCQ
jgi:hypothetical protein